MAPSPADPAAPAAGRPAARRPGEAQAQPRHHRRRAPRPPGGGHRRWRSGVRLPDIPVASNVVVFALFNLNLIVFLLLLVLLFRNLVKLWFERRNKVIGSEFKTKLVVAFLSLSLAPGHPDLPHRLELHQHVDRGLVQAPGRAPARPGDARWPRPTTSASRTTALRHGQLHGADVIERDGLLAETGARRWSSYLPSSRSVSGSPPSRVFGRGRAGAGAREGPGARCPPSRRPSTRSRCGRRSPGQEITTVRELDNGDLIQAMVPVRDRRPAARGRRDRGRHPRAAAARGAAARHQPRPSRSTSSSSSSRSRSRASTSCSSC